MTSERQLAGHCKECGDPIYVGDKAVMAYSPTTPDGLAFTCESCAVSQGAVFPDDEPVH